VVVDAAPPVEDVDDQPDQPAAPSDDDTTLLVEADAPRVGRLPRRSGDDDGGGKAVRANDHDNNDAGVLWIAGPAERKRPRPAAS
jgi:hypothetical protein